MREPTAIASPVCTATDLDGRLFCAALRGRAGDVPQPDELPRLLMCGDWAYVPQYQVLHFKWGEDELWAAEVGIGLQDGRAELHVYVAAPADMARERSARPDDLDDCPFTEVADFAKAWMRVDEVRLTRAYDAQSGVTRVTAEDERGKYCVVVSTQLR